MRRSPFAALIVASVATPPAGEPAPPSGGRGVFTAIQDQLGLKLERARAPVEVLAIDTIAQPTAD